MGRSQTLQKYLQSFWRVMPSLWRTVRHFRPYVRKQRGLIATGFLTLFVEVGMRLLEPWPLKFIIDHVITAQQPGGQPALPVVSTLDPAILLLVAVISVVVIAGLRSMAAYWSTVGFALAGNRVLTAVRSDLYRHLQSLSLSFHTKARSGDLIVRIISDVGLLKDVVVTAALPLLGNVLILIGMLGVMFWLNWQLALLGLVTAPLFWLSTVRLGRRIKEVSHKQRQREGAMAATAAESISAIKVVQALSLENTFSQTFTSQNTKSLKEGVQGTRLAAKLERTVDLFIALSTALVLWYGAQLVLRNALTLGELLVFLTYLKNAFKPVRDFAKYTGRLAKAAAAGDRVIDLLEQTPEIRNLPGAQPAPTFRGVVRFDNVSFAYELGQHVLEDITFEIQPDQRVALVGPSGNGKSTLISLILRLYDPDKGRVLIDGHDIRGYMLDSLRSQISVVLQDTLLFAASIRDNIAYGSPDATSEEIEAAARLANAHDFIMALPQRYDTILGERGVTLSGGQRQRLAIARAAVRKAPILILDEPATGLDEANERIVLDALERLAEGRTTFMITHDLHLAACADLILYLEGGRLLEYGTHAELMQADGRYAALYWLQTAAREFEIHKEELDVLAS